MVSAGVAAATTLALTGIDFCTARDDTDGDPAWVGVVVAVEAVAVNAVDDSAGSGSRDPAARDAECSVVLAVPVTRPAELLAVGLSLAAAVCGAVEDPTVEVVAAPAPWELYLPPE